MNIALIIAGGIGSRVNANIPKQYIKINNKPIICYTIEKFLNNSKIEKILVVCHKDYIDEVSSYKTNYNYKKDILICEAGATGLESVANGIKFLSNICSDNDLILIHDAVRPFVDQNTIDNNIEIASKYGCAVAACSCAETLVFSNDNLLSTKKIDRDHLKRILTPQTFKLGNLKDLYSDKELLKTSKAHSTFELYMEMGNPIYISKSNEKNFKITYPEDVEYFQNFFRNDDSK